MGCLYRSMRIDYGARCRADSGESLTNAGGESANESMLEGVK